MTLKEKFTTYIEVLQKFDDTEKELIILKNDQSDVSEAEITIDLAEDILKLKKSILAKETLSQNYAIEFERMQESIIEDLSMIGAKKVRLAIGTDIYLLELRYFEETGVFGDKSYKSELLITKP